VRQTLLALLIALNMATKLKIEEKKLVVVSATDSDKALLITAS
jgi:hypothetical protein